MRSVSPISRKILWTGLSVGALCILMWWLCCLSVLLCLLFPFLSVVLGGAPSDECTTEDESRRVCFGSGLLAS